MRYALYCRTSTERQKQTATIETQLDAATQYTNLHQIKITERYIDDGVSSRIPLGRRPDGSRLVRDARQKKFDALLVFKFDRLARVTREQLSIVEEIEACGVQVLSITEPLLNDSTSSTGTFLRTMVAGVGQYERDTFKERSIAGHYRAARQAKWQGGLAPFGYSVNRDGHLEINEEEAGIIREIFELYINNHSSAKIADRLNARGLGSPRTFRTNISARWTDNTVGTILRNEIYTGEFTWRRTKGVTREGRLVTRIATPSDDRVTFPIPQIVSEDDFQKAKSLRQLNQRFAARNLRHNYLLRGLIRCGICGRAFIGSSVKRSYGFYTYYQCSSQSAGARRQHCGNKTVRGFEIEERVRRDLADFAANPGPVIEELEIALREREGSHSNVEQQQRKVAADLKGKETERARVLNFARKGIISESEAERELRQLQAEVDALQAESVRLSDRQAREREAETYLRSVGSLLHQFASDLTDISEEKYTLYVRQLVSQVVVNTVEMEGKRQPHAEITYFFPVPDSSLDGCSSAVGNIS
jgi:site-specific DNA recombinase